MYAQTIGDTSTELTGHDIASGDVNFSHQTMLKWSDAERAAYGIFPIVDDTVPEGKITTGWTLEKVGDVVQRHFTLADAPPPAVPNSISDRQFAHALALSGLLTETEALAWVKVGEVPAALQVVVDAISDNDVRFGANMLLGGATVFERDHPMVSALAAGLAMSSEQIDAIWQLGASL